METRFRSSRSNIAVAILLIVLCALPAAASDFQLSILALIFLFAATGQAWNLMMGYAGQLSLGHSLYFGIGAYVMGLLIQKLGLSAWAGLPSAFAVCAFFGAVCGAVGFRFAVRGVYFAVLTIAFAELARILFEHWEYSGATGGLFLGAVASDNNPLASLRGGATFFYYALLATLALIWAACAVLINARVGFRWRAIREDEDAARAIGVPAFRLKVLASALSAGFTGICGAWFALMQGSLFPDGLFGMGMSINLIIAPIVGGLGTLFGPLIGALVTVPLNEISKELANHFSLSGLNQIIYGVLLGGVVLFAPHGIWPPLARLLGLGARK
jgi:branched-chain amino acid transport system permease protein